MRDKKSIDQIMSSLDNVKKNNPDVKFVDRMESLAVAYAFKSSYFSKSIILSIAASLLLLIVANIYTLSDYNPNSKEKIETYTSYSLVPINSIYK